MKQHKYNSLVKFVHLDGIKEFKETDPSLFSDDGISTSTIEVDNGRNAPVTMEDARNACLKYLSGQISESQLQQWGEWIHCMDFFDLIPGGEEPDCDETMIDVITEIDILDTAEPKQIETKVKEILKTIDNWLDSHRQ